MPHREVGVSAVEIQVEVVGRHRSAALRAEAETKIRIEEIVGRLRVRVAGLELITIAEALLQRQDRGVVFAVVKGAVSSTKQPTVSRERPAIARFE